MENTLCILTNIKKTWLYKWYYVKLSIESFTLMATVDKIKLMLFIK